jgi:hypothetical protein
MSKAKYCNVCLQTLTEEPDGVCKKCKGIPILPQLTQGQWQGLWNQRNKSLPSAPWTAEPGAVGVVHVWLLSLLQAQGFDVKDNVVVKV